MQGDVQAVMSCGSTLLLVSPCRQDVEVEEVVSVWLTYLFTHTFSFQSHQLSDSRWNSACRNNLMWILQCIISKYSTTCERTKTRMRGWLGLASQLWLVYPIQTLSKSLQSVGCRLEKGLSSSEVCGHSENHRGKKEEEKWSSPSSAAAAMNVCVRVCVHANPQKEERPCDTTHSQVQCMEGLALDLVERVGWAQILEAGTGWEQGFAMRGGWAGDGGGGGGGWPTTQCSRDIKRQTPCLTQNCKQRQGELPPVLPKRIVLRGFTYSFNTHVLISPSSRDNCLP